MANRRKTGGREELDALWAQTNALIADAIAIRSALLLGLSRGNNQVLGLDQLAGEVTDLTAVRTEVIASIDDLAAIRDRRDLGIMSLTQLAAMVTDLTAIRAETILSIDDLQNILDRSDQAVVGNPALADATVDGKIKNVNACDFRVKGTFHSKAATDNLWDLSAEVDTDGTHFRAYRLYLDASGTATFVASTADQLSEALAIADLPALDLTKSAIGVYTAGVSTDFDGAAGLAAQGTFVNGWPVAYALTASDPAALVTSATVGIADGTTDGALKTQSDVEFLIAGAAYSKAATDDLWDLNAEVDTDGTHFRAYWLLLSTAGAASFDASTDELSAAAAIAALPALAGTHSVVGVYVAGVSCDFDGVAGLAAQGDIHDGWPSAYALTASDPAALTTSTTVGIADGSTAGNIKTQSDTEYQIAGKVYRKAATDDLWDLSGETDTLALKYRAYWLYVDASGVASFAANAADHDSAADAVSNLPAEVTTKCPVGVFVAGPATDFDAGGGLAAQGDLYNGRPAALADPAALTSNTTTLVSA